MRLNPLIQAEVSVLVDVIRAPYALFLETNECRSKFLHGAFVHKYVFSSMNTKFSTFPTHSLSLHIDLNLRRKHSLD